tara:strand:- start:5706 stop:7472 length:1767 start_codon:yes stop_codon:yes gene_type:complete
MTGEEYEKFLVDWKSRAPSAILPDGTIDGLLLELEEKFYDVEWVLTPRPVADRLTKFVEQQYRIYGKEMPPEFAEAVTNIGSADPDADPGEMTDEDLVEGSLASLADTNFPQWMKDRFFNGNDGLQRDADQLLIAINAKQEENGEPPFLSLFDVPDVGLNTYIEETIIESLFPTEEEEEEQFEPYTNLKLKFGTDFQIKTVELNNILQDTGFDQDQFRRTLELADAYDMRREGPGEEIAWQVPLMLMNMTGLVASSGTYEERQESLTRLRTLGQEIKTRKAALGPGMTNKSIRDLEREYQQALSEAKLLQTGQVAQLAGRDFGVDINVGQLFNGFSEGIDLYGNIETFGILHAVDPGLAARLWAAEGDFTKVSPNDTNLVGMYMSRAIPGAGEAGDLLAQTLVRWGYGEAAGDALVIDLMARADVVNNPGDYGPNANGSGEKTIPDRVAVEARARDLMETMYPQGAAESEIADITDRVIAEYMDAPDDQMYDLDSQTESAVRGLPQYEKFYGNKPGGVSDSRYAASMTLGAQSILGAEAGLTGAAGLGMQSGKYQTAVGAAAGSSLAFDNSTFMGRLAQAAKVVSANT